MSTTDWDNEPLAEMEADSQSVDIWGILNRRKWLVITITLLGLLGGALKYSQTDPTYESVAQVLIEPKTPPSVAMAQDGGFSARGLVADVEKHPIMIRSPQIIGAAATQHQLEKLASLAKAENPVGTIIKNLTVSPVTDGLGIYNIAYRGPSAEDTGKVVNAVLNQYHDYLELNHRNVGRETRELIVRAEKELLTQLQAKELAYQEFREKDQSDLIYKNGQGINFHQERQSVIEQERSNLLLEINDKQSQLEAISNHLESNGELEALILIDELPKLEFFEDDKAAKLARTEVDRSILLPLLLEEEELISRYGKDHPRVKSIHRRIASTRDFYKKYYDIDLATIDKEEAPDNLLQGSAVERFVNAEIAALKYNLQQLQRRSQHLDKLFTAEETGAKQLASLQFKDEMFRADLARTQQLYDVVLKQLEEMDVMGDYDGYTFSILANAGEGEQVAPSLAKTFALAGMLGFMLGAGLAYLVDLADKSFHSPMDVTRQLGLPVVGHIPVIENDTVLPDLSHIAPVMCTIHRPMSTGAEAYRTVRTALFFNTRGQSEQVIQITSPSPGDGKSTLAANLAVAIANSGKSTLLLDADFRRPTQHKVFGLKSDIGLASVVDGSASLTEAAQMVDCVPNLTVMACGQRPDNPSELLSSARFHEVLDQLRHEYDFVIVDTPPLLAVSDPSAVAAQVDGVILEMRIDKRVRTLATRSRDMLAQLGAHVVGVVINGIDSEASQYSYGAGRYSYGAKKYGYSYNYEYGHEPAPTEKV